MQNYDVFVCNNKCNDFFPIILFFCYYCELKIF